MTLVWLSLHCNFLSPSIHPYLQHEFQHKRRLALASTSTFFLFVWHAFDFAWLKLYSILYNKTARTHDGYHTNHYRPRNTYFPACFFNGDASLTLFISIHPFFWQRFGSFLGKPKKHMHFNSKAKGLSCVHTHITSALPIYLMYV